MSSHVLPRPPKGVPYRVPPNIQREIEQGKYNTDQRFPGNRFLELKAMRPSMRTYSIKHKLISDPEHRTDLTGAITVVGTCLDMCPEYERHEREFQKDVDDWEKIPGTNPKRIDHLRAVKKYRRSAAGNDEPLESDLRPPEILKMTLDYLFYELLDKHGLEATYAFIRDRTRAIRTDFTIQHDKGPIAIECFERIARFHILAVHRFCERDDVRGFDYWQEIEQMMKTLQSLMQFYDDNEGKLESPNEAEFRSYYILAHIRDTNSMRRLQSLAPHIFLDPTLQTALEFRSYAQRNTHFERRSSSRRAAKLKFRNSEACLNAFTRFFKRVQNEGTSYLMGCLLEYHFGGVRKGAIHALWKAYSARHRPLPTSYLMEMLGIDSEEKTVEVARRFGMSVVEEVEELSATSAVQLNKNSKFEHANQMSQRHSMNLVESKRDDLADVDIVDGRFPKAHSTWTLQGSNAVSQTPLHIPTKAVEWNSKNTSSLPRNIPVLTPFPHPSAPSSAPFAPPTSNWGIFGQMLTPQPPSVSHASRSTSQVPIMPQSAFFFGAGSTPSPPKPIPSVSSLASVSVTAAPAASPGSYLMQSDRSALSLPVPRTESVFTPPPSIQNAQMAAAPITSPQSRHPSLLPVSTSPPADGSSPPLVKAARPDTCIPVTPKSPSPPRPTKEEILYERQQELRRVVALAQARADRHLTFQLLFKAFTFWKRKVMELGRARELTQQRREQFKRSVRDMGLSSTPIDMGKAKLMADYHVEEDLISWEDTSQASSSISLRRRSRKPIKRADDEMTLAAIQEAEAIRIKLWEPRTFLSAITKRVHLSIPTPCGWEVWLSTTSQNSSTAEWLRLKLGANISTASTEYPALDQISISNAVSQSAGRSHGPGIIFIDLTPSTDERTIEVDLSRIRTIMSLLPANRCFVPSALLLQWTEASDDLPTPISSELNQLQERGTIDSWQILTFTNDGRHFDDQFLTALQSLPLDTVGRLANRVSIDDVFQMFFAPWDITLNEWISSCHLTQGTGFDWRLYGKVLTVMLGHINRLAAETTQVCQIKKSIVQFPFFRGVSIVDEQTAHEVFMEYLNTDWLASNQDAMLLRTELSMDSGRRDFYIKAVPERLAHLMLFQLRATVSPEATFFLSIEDITSKVASFVDVLRATHILQRRSSPIKRPRVCDQSDNLASFARSVEEPGKKRRRQDVLTTANGVTSPSSAPNNYMPKPDTLTRLRATVAKARQSVEDFRAMRHDAEQSHSLTEAPQDTWAQVQLKAPDDITLKSIRDVTIGSTRFNFWK